MSFGQKLIDTYENKRPQLEEYLRELETIIKESGELLEGNCFYYHQTLKLFPNLFYKQVNLFVCGQQS